MSQTSYSEVRISRSYTRFAGGIDVIAFHGTATPASPLATSHSQPASDRIRRDGWRERLASTTHASGASGAPGGFAAFAEVGSGTQGR